MNARAAEAFTRELQLAYRYRYDRMLYEAISGLAAVAAARGEDELAAHLVGAAELTGRDRRDPVIAGQLEDRYCRGCRCNGAPTLPQPRSRSIAITAQAAKTSVERSARLQLTPQAAYAAAGKDRAAQAGRAVKAL